MTGLSRSSLALLLLMSAAACSSENPVQKTAEQNAVIAGIQTGQSRIGSDDPLMVTFFVRNATASDVRLLMWNTPLEPILSADVLTVTHDGQPVKYRGRMVKRAKPTSDNYLTLEPGEIKEQLVDLSRHYAVSDNGTYTITFTPPVETDSGLYRMEDVVVELSDSAATVVRE